jgi:hypothetical protein
MKKENKAEEEEEEEDLQLSAVGGRLHAPVALSSVPIVQEAGWTSETVSTGTENLAHNWVRTTDRPTCSYMECTHPVA